MCTESTTATGSSLRRWLERVEVSCSVSVLLWVQAAASSRVTAAMKLSLMATRFSTKVRQTPRYQSPGLFRQNRYDHPLVPREGGRPFIRHFENEMDGRGAVHYGRGYRNIIQVGGVRRKADASLVCSRFGILEPEIAHRISVGVGGAGGAQVELLARLNGKPCRHAEVRDGRVVALPVTLRRPGHAGGKIVLVFRAPAPDGGLNTGIAQFINKYRIDSIGPDRARFGFVLRPTGPAKRPRIGVFKWRQIKFVPAAPAAIIRVFRVIEPVVDQVQKTGGIPFHPIGNVGIGGAQWAVALLDIAGKPFGRHYFLVGTGHSKGHSEPGSMRIIVSG